MLMPLIFILCNYSGASAATQSRRAVLQTVPARWHGETPATARDYVIPPGLKALLAGEGTDWRLRLA